MSSHTASSRDRNRNRFRGFALPEVGALVVIAALGLALLVPTMNETRRQAGLGRDIANLRQIGLWTGMYAADNNGLYWTFSWEAGHKNSKWPALNTSSTKLQAAVTQTNGASFFSGEWSVVATRLFQPSCAGGLSRSVLAGLGLRL